MLEQFAAYFHRIEMPQPIIERAEAVCNTFKEFIELPITAVFVSDAYEQPGGIRRYDSMWLLAGNNIMECKRFVVQTNIDAMRHNKIFHIEFTAIDLPDLRGPSTINSRLNVAIKLSDPGPTGGILTAAHTNCSPLVDFVIQVFWPPKGS
jgi:hypothetical protein